MRKTELTAVAGFQDKLAFDAKHVPKQKIIFSFTKLTIGKFYEFFLLTSKLSEHNAIASVPKYRTSIILL